MVHHGATLRKRLGFGEAANGIDIELAHRVIGRIHTRRSLIIKSFQVATTLGEIHLIDFHPSILLSDQQGTVGGITRRFKIGHQTFDYAVSLTLTKPN